MSDFVKKAGFSKRAAPEVIDRRADSRSQIVTSAEVIEADSGARLSTRISDVSSGGCFVDALNPLPVGSRVRLSMLANNAQFEITGLVIYIQPGLGMGISFNDATREQRSALDAWLGKLGAQGEIGNAVLRPATQQNVEPNSSAVSRLIHMLVARGILTEEEADALLREPLL